MNNEIMNPWQQWESRIQEWLKQTEDNLQLNDVTSLDRIMLTLLAVKYQVSYQDLNKVQNKQDGEKTRSNRSKQKDEEESEKTSTIILSRKKIIEEQESERLRLFYDITGHHLTSQQVPDDILPEWEDFVQLCDWHGVEFIRRFSHCLHRLLVKYISSTEAYQKFISQPKVISPVKKIDNCIYHPKNEGELFLSIDIKSANFAALQYINAIDAQVYPTWPDFLSIFVGPRICFLKSKKLRVRFLSQLPEYYKVEALWTYLTADAYQRIILPCIEEKTNQAECVNLSGDEVIIHLKENDEQKVLDLLHYIQQHVNQIPIVTFTVQAYRLRTFDWKNQHTCFARIFIGPSEQPFDLKCVPRKDENYEQAYKDCQIAFNL